MNHNTNMFSIVGDTAKITFKDGSIHTIQGTFNNLLVDGVCQASVERNGLNPFNFGNSDISIVYNKAEEGEHCGIFTITTLDFISYVFV